jgi:hypothetical protein
MMNAQVYDALIDYYRGKNCKVRKVLLIWPSFAIAQLGLVHDEVSRHLNRRL